MSEDHANSEPDRIQRVAAVVGEQIATFELGTVCQVFGLDRSDEGLPVFDLALAGARPGPHPTTSGFTVDVPCGPEALATADLVVVPAWPQLEAPVDPVLLDAVRTAHDRGARILSICSGAFLLAAAGLLDGRRSATHWQFEQRLLRFRPAVRLDRDVLYVTDGRVTTSAGAAAGIDACLAVLRDDRGATVAAEVARRMVVAAHRAGGQAQFVSTPLPPTGAGTGLQDAVDWALTHLDGDLTVADLAARAAVSPRTLARRFAETLGTTPQRWLLEQRLHRAQQLLETTDLPVDVVAARAGVGHGDTLRHHFARHRGVSPSAYRASFRTTAPARG